MRQLFSILLMNAWGGLRQAVSLSAAATVLLGATTLLVASNVTAGALPDPSLSSSNNTRGNTHTSVVGSSALALLGGGTSQQQTHPTHHTKQPQLKQQAKAGRPTVVPSTLSSTGTGSRGSNSSQSSPITAVSLSLASLTCQQGQSGQLTYTEQSAQLTLQSPTTASGTVSWYWEVQATDGSSTSDSQQAAGSENIAADTTQVALPDGSSSQPLFTITVNSGETYRFRLQVSGAVSATSDWVSVPQASSCQ